MPNKENSTVSKRFIFGILLLLASVLIGLLIGTGFVKPYPSQNMAYMFCFSGTVLGIAQIIVAKLSNNNPH